jgi:hypothetical protein
MYYREKRLSLGHWGLHLDRQIRDEIGELRTLLAERELELLS